MSILTTSIIFYTVQALCIVAGLLSNFLKNRRSVHKVESQKDASGVEHTVAANPLFDTTSENAPGVSTASGNPGRARRTFARDHAKVVSECKNGNAAPIEKIDRFWPNA